MSYRTAAKRLLTIAIAVQLLVATQFASMAQAEMISTDIAIQAEAADMNRDKLLAGLQRQDVRDELVRHGVDPAEAETRLAALTDAEIRSMLIQINEQNAGGDLVGTLAFVFLVLLLTDLLCLTNLFSFTRCAR